MKSRRFALVHMGTDVMHGMEFIAAEVLKTGHQIQWFDGDEEDAINGILNYEPHFACFSPLTTFFGHSVRLAGKIKKEDARIRSVFGGVHVMAVPDIIRHDDIDIIAQGPVFNAIEKIINSNVSEIIKGELDPLNEIMPAQGEKARKYFLETIALNKVRY